MTRDTVQPAAVAAPPAAAARPPRLFFVDHLRSALMILVVLHHVSLVYGASLDGYYYVEPPFGDPDAFLVLLVFALFNQSWFMGAFFLLSGYFTPGSFDRKGPAAFVRDRLVRLGIPLAVFFFVLSPISFIGYYLMPAELTGITTPLTWQGFWRAYPDFLGIGPLWFVALLLVFTAGYAAWRALTGIRSASSRPKSSAPGYLALGGFVLALALVSYVTRMVIPLGKTVLQFPSLAYLPQYLSFFVIGVVAYRRDWFRTVRGSTGGVGLLVAALAAVFLFPLAFSGHLFEVELSPALDNAMGHGHWQSAIYALWDTTFAVGLFLGLLTLFRRFVNGPGRFGRFLAQQSYAVYVIHIPIVVFGAYLLRGIELGSLAKFGVVSAIVVPTCFVAAFLLRRVPLVSRVL